MSIGTEIDKHRSLHSIYMHDPLIYKNYLDKNVSISTEDGKTHTGIVYTVDPVSESIILVNLDHKKDEVVQLKIIMKHAVKNVQCIDDNKHPLPELFGCAKMDLTASEVAERKRIVLKILIDNRFPVTEENGILQIEKTVTIEPPYGPENCICTNSTILNRIQNILSHALT